MLQELHVVTGAFGYSGCYIARRLLDKGRRVRTLTNSPRRKHPLQGRIEAVPFNFEDESRLAASLEGASVLYNTYWVRFNHPRFNYADATQNTLALFRAAVKADVRRIVHVSITNPSEGSRFEYFRNKALLERALAETGLSYAILRPTVLFGDEDILVNNIAWTLRRFPVFGVFGDGSYRLQPIFVDDLARLAVEQGSRSSNTVIDAIGPETFTYRDLVRTIGGIIGKPRPVISVPPWLGHAAGWGIGKLVGDVTITRDEIGALMSDLLYVDAPPAGDVRLTDWARLHADTLGRHYASELRRRTDRNSAY